MLSPTDEKIHLNPAHDMWMLGTLVYEVMTGEPYWRKSLRDVDVLQIMADPNKPLPHEEKPVLQLVQLILKDLLHRDPAQRLSSSDLIKRLEADMATAGARTMNPGPIVNQDDVILDGN
jgi:serine/threonine protein kinase